MGKSKSVKPAQREAPVLRAVGVYLKTKGHLYMRVNRVRIAGKQGNIHFVRHSDEQKGWPDYMVFDHGFPHMATVCVAIECKSSTGNLTKEQKKFRGIWEVRGLRYIVVRPENWLEELKKVGL